jgi:MFS family permease
MRALLADRRTLMFFLGNAISTLGDTAMMLALAVWVRELTGSAALAGLDMAAFAVGAMFAPLTGVLVDRVRRKPLLIWTYLATAAMLMALLGVHDRAQIPLVATVTFLYGLSGAISGGAQTALIQQIVPTGLLAQANGLQQTLSQGMRLVTPALGVGLLAWLGGHVVAVMDAATFLVAVACLLGVQVDEPTPNRGGTRGLAELTAGMRYLARTPLLRQVTIADAVTFLAFGAFVTLGIELVTTGLHHAPSWMGLLVTVQGVGGAAGGIVAGRLAARWGDRMLMVWALVGMAVLTPVFAIPNGVVVAVTMALFGFCIPWYFVGSGTIFQKYTPRRLMGRVNGANAFAVQAAQATGNVVGAALVAALYYRDVCYIIAATIGLTALYLGTRRTEPIPNLNVPAVEVAAAH